MGRPIAVTCATSGIGQAVCQQLVESGHDLVLFGRDEDELAGLRDRHAGRGCRVAIWRVDLDSEDDLRRLAAEAGTRIGQLDGLVVIYPRISTQPAGILSATQHSAVWQRCFLRPLELVRILLDHVEPDGRIVIASGISNSQVFPGLGVANVVRAAWLAQAKLLAFVLGERRIRVNTVSLGGTFTDRFVENLARSPAPGPLDDHPAVIPLGAYGAPRDAAYVITSLLGPFTAHMTGANIVCDGGLSRHYC